MRTDASWTVLKLAAACLEQWMMRFFSLRATYDHARHRAGLVERGGLRKIGILSWVAHVGLFREFANFYVGKKPHSGRNRADLRMLAWCLQDYFPHCDFGGVRGDFSFSKAHHTGT